MNAERIDVFAVIDEEIRCHRDNLPEFQPELDAMLAVRAVVADLIAKADNAQRLIANAISAGQIDAAYVGIFNDLNAALGRIGGQP